MFKVVESAQVAEGGGENHHGLGERERNKIEASLNNTGGFYFTRSFLLFTSCFFLLLLPLDEILDHASEFHREDELGGGTLAEVLECLEVLEGHRLMVNGLC